MPCPGRWQSLFERRKFVLRAILTLNLVIDHVDAKVVMIAPFVVVGINGVAERLTQACLGFELLLMLERGQSGSFAVGDVTFLSIELGQLFYRSLAAGLSVPQALTAARQSLIRDARYRHPYYWAAYYASGVGTTNLDEVLHDTSN